MDWLKGKRTYILVASLVLSLAVRWLDGTVGIAEAVTEVLVAVGLLTARAPGAAAAKELAGK